MPQDGCLTVETPITSTIEQLELHLVSDAPVVKGYETWQRERLANLIALGRHLGLPLGHEAEILLKDGTCLRGQLSLAREELWVEDGGKAPPLLRVDRCTFEYSDIDSCVRLDLP